MMRWAPLAVFAVLALALFIGLFREDRDALPSVYIDRPIPEFEMRALDDAQATVSSQDIRGAQPVVLNFWATWCGPCIVEHPKLMELSGRPDIRMIGLNYDHDTEKALAFLEREGNPFDLVGHEKKRKAWIDFGVAALPETFVIAGDGTVVYKHVGPINPGELEEKILPAVEEARRRGG